MLFNSLGFLIFLPIVFIIHWLLLKKKHKHQNLFLLLSSYFFYSCWDYRFLFLLVFSTLLDYFTGIKISKSTSSRKRKIWFLISIGVNLGVLFVFKYYNFFLDSFQVLLTNVGFKSNNFTLSLVLPIGISFYTFHGVSYVIDVYKKRINHESNFVDYSLFVSFFPLLVAGPIERATHLLPQLKSERVMSYSSFNIGLKQILWGLFKKVVIADQSAEIANLIFDHPQDYSGASLYIGAVFFAFQIYGDFSGYSDIALGTAKLFGVNLLKNFSYPYFSRSIAEFWRRWHISLSSWFRDYVYIPLGGSKTNKYKSIRNIFIIFLLSGFWHGANWTFIFWGGINAIYFLPGLLLKKNRQNIEIVAKDSRYPSFFELFTIIRTFILVVLAWVFFRSPNIQFAFNYIFNIFHSLFTKKSFLDLYNLFYWKIQWQLPLLLVLFFVVEWGGRMFDFGLKQTFSSKPRFFRWSFYYLLIFLIIYFSGSEQQFIYFQF